MRKTKIVCTLGPACTNEKTLRDMMLAGMNVARLNFSHGDHEMHKSNIELFRRVRDSLGLPGAVMLDTKGPEIRVKNFAAGKVTLKSGDTFTLTNRDVCGDENEVSISYPSLPAQLKRGNVLLIDDGRVKLKVERTSESDILCRVLIGGEVSNHKGINIPSVHINMSYISEADREDLLFGIRENVDFISASFVRCKEDVITLRKFLDYNGGHTIRIISKIENLSGVRNFDEILEYSDGIMVARGDMGVEIEYQKLPGLQKRFISRCYQSGKMVITATQMLESMIYSPTPTRAEITDIANAVFDGTSAIMLSGESAIGKYPVQAVQKMATIAEYAEQDAFELCAYKEKKFENKSNDITNAICDATCRAAIDIDAKVIIALTSNGTTARNMSKFRPEKPIVAATTDIKTFHQLALSWGVYPVYARPQKTTDDLFAHAVDCAKQLDMVEKNDRVVITGGVPLGVSGSTNIIKVQIVD